MVAHASNIIIQEVKAGESEVQSHQLHSKSEASLVSLRYCLKRQQNKRTPNRGEFAEIAQPIKYWVSKYKDLGSNYL